MALDIESATVALFDRLSAIDGFRLKTRVLEDWTSVAPAQQPALQLTSGEITTEESKGALGTPPLWIVRLEAFVYVQSPNPATAPSTILNPLIADVCNAMLWAPGDVPVSSAPFVANPTGVRYTTLGGRCAQARVSGTIQRAEGLKIHTAVALIPITMVLTS